MAINVEGYKLHVRSVAGVESCCYVESVDIAFDMGVCFSRVASKSNVFITHGHVDHINAFITHAGRRNLLRLKPARYFVPPHLVAPMQRMLDDMEIMQGDRIDAQIVPLQPLQEVQLSPQWVVKAFSTCHRVPSLGYVLYRKQKKLKPEYVGLDKVQMAEIRQSGVKITELITTAEIGYTGDTTVDVFQSENDFLQCRVLITEATYADDKKSCADATSRGHIHLQQLTENAQWFDRVRALVLVHFSARYNWHQLNRILDTQLPDSLRDKVYISGYK